MGLPNVPTDRAGVCLITGGSNGIGLATTQALLQLGYCVVVAGRDAKRLAAAVAPRQALNTFADAQIEDVLVTNLLSPMRLVRSALAELRRPGDLANGPSVRRGSVVLI